MDEIRIDRLTLQLSGLTHAEGELLAMRITEGLAAADIPVDVAAEHGAIRIDVHTASPGDLGSLSDRVVADVLRELQRSM